MTAVLGHRADGHGEPLLLLNGGMMTIASWNGLVPPLATRFQVHRCDFRGQLCSPGEPHAELSPHVTDVVELLKALGIERAHVLGTSFGAEVGMLLAATHPARVASLIVATATDVATTALRGGGGELGGAWRSAARGGNRREALVLGESLFYSDGYRRTNREVLDNRLTQVELFPEWWFGGVVGLLATLENLDLRRYLGAIKCPTLVVAAGQDRVMPVERSHAMAAAIPGARLEVIEGSGHALVVEKPVEFVTVCLAFLEDVKRTGGSS
jgi:3-oxoadipate enol-lactonase